MVGVSEERHLESLVCLWAVGMVDVFKQRSVEKILVSKDNCGDPGIRFESKLWSRHPGISCGSLYLSRKPLLLSRLINTGLATETAERRRFMTPDASNRSDTSFSEGIS